MSASRSLFVFVPLSQPRGNAPVKMLGPRSVIWKLALVFRQCGRGVKAKKGRNPHVVSLTQITIEHSKHIKGSEARPINETNGPRARSDAPNPPPYKRTRPGESRDSRAAYPDNLSFEEPGSTATGEYFERVRSERRRNGETTFWNLAGITAPKNA